MVCDCGGRMHGHLHVDGCMHTERGGQHLCHQERSLSLFPLQRRHLGRGTGKGVGPEKGDCPSNSLDIALLQSWYFNRLGSHL